jgi:hypothetical protein
VTVDLRDLIMPHSIMTALRLRLVSWLRLFCFSRIHRLTEILRERKLTSGPEPWNCQY